MLLLDMCVNTEIEFIRIRRINHLGAKPGMTGMTTFFEGSYPTISTLGENNLSHFSKAIAFNPKGRMSATKEWMEKKFATMVAAGNHSEELGALKPEHMFGGAMKTETTGFLDGMRQERFMGIQYDESMERNFYRFLTNTMGTNGAFTKEYVDVYPVGVLEFDETVTKESEEEHKNVLEGLF